MRPESGQDRFLHPTDLPLGGLPDLLPGAGVRDAGSVRAPADSVSSGTNPPAAVRDPRAVAAELFARQALRQAAAGNLDVALERIENAIRFDPRDFRLYISLGNLLLRAGRVSEARQAYEAALVAAPQSQLAASNYAAALAAQGHLIRALYVLGIADERRPGHPLIRANLGSVHALLGNDEQAVAIWTELARDSPALLRLALEDPLLIEPLRRPGLNRFRIEVAAGLLRSDQARSPTVAASGDRPSGDPPSPATPGRDTVLP